MAHCKLQILKPATTFPQCHHTTQPNQTKTAVLRTLTTLFQFASFFLVPERSDAFTSFLCFVLVHTIYRDIMTRLSVYGTALAVFIVGM